MKNIFNKLKSDPRKAVGAIFLSVGVFICLVALLFLGVRAIRIERIKNSAEEFAYTKGWVEFWGDKDKIDVLNMKSGDMVNGILNRQYVSTAFKVHQDDIVIAYYDKKNSEVPIVVDLLNKDGKSALVTFGCLVILVGVVLGILGIIILVREKTLSKVQDSQS